MEKAILTAQQKDAKKQVEAKYQFLAGKKYSSTNELTHKRIRFPITGITYNPKLEFVILDNNKGWPVYMEVKDLDELIAKGKVEKYFEEEGYPHTGKLWTVTTLK